MKKKSVLLRAPVLTQSGYGTHARQLAHWLLSRGDLDVSFQALPWGNTPWHVDPFRCDGLVGKVMEKTVNPKSKKFDVSFQLQLPNEWDKSLAMYNVGISAMVETDRCNTQWTLNCNEMDHVVVPSKHALQSINASGGTTTPMTVIPEAFSSSCIKPDLVPAFDVLSTNFNFLLFGQVTGTNPYNDRKNTFFTLKWLFEEFQDDKDVGIVIKTNTGRNTLIDRNNVTTMMKQLISETRKSPYPKLHIVHGDMTDDEVASIYRHPQVKALVSATRGEGFGLPLLEAAASALPVIATGWSGHTDFLNRGKYVNLAYDIKEVHASRIDNKIFMPGSRWAEVQEKDFKKRVRKFYESSSIPKEWANDLSKKIVDNYGLEHVSKMYDEQFKDVLS